MSKYPFSIDDDSTIFRVDDNITEISGQNFNQVRDAIFKIEMELGIKPSGTQGNLKDFLSVSHNDDGTIKSSALSSVGLVTLPIDNLDVGINAGIEESKLNLQYSTNTLKLLIEGNAQSILTIQEATERAILTLNKHIAGGSNPDERHVISHIDINAIPSDLRDVSFTWGGLKNIEGGIRPATNLGEALEQINDELVEHQLSADPIFGHTATGISVDPSKFLEIPGDVDSVQEAIESLDQIESRSVGAHRATMHSQGITPDARSFVIRKPDLEIDGKLPDGYLDGYGETVVPTRQAITYLASTGGIEPVNNRLNGDDVIEFIPENEEDKYKLDSEFVLVKPGDIARINYNNGLEAMYVVDSIRFIPGEKWSFRINRNNLTSSELAYARIDRPLFDKEIWGIAASAVSNPFPTSSFSGFLGSVIVSDPKSAVALGNGFNPNHLDENHYLLYLKLYPTGNPEEKIISLPGIDVTGNGGTTPGDYTIENIVQATNNGFRAAGVNARFIAFEYNGNFGITMADAINGASFSIVTGIRDGNNIVEGTYVNNVINDFSSLQRDALGLGSNGSDYASPEYSAVFENSTAAIKPTKILMPRKRRNYIANGSKRDYLVSAPNTENNEIIDGYWEATITSRRVDPGITARTQYTIEKDLKSARLFPGKTITVQPLVGFDNPFYKDSDYGRFIIESVQYVPACPGDPAKTLITVINGVHADPDSNPVGTSTGPGADLKLAIHFDNTTVGFSEAQISSSSSGEQFHRLHEIYTTSTSESFSHERLRMPIQVGGGNLLPTYNWRVRGASPKLVGFTDNNNSLNRYVRFYILNYNSTSGEFDGYLGRRNITDSQIFDYGPIVTGRKDEPVRFYDKSGIDYIELEYIETSISATSIPAPAYVDIQIFPSLELNDELLLVATCEVNWSSQSNIPSTGPGTVSSGTQIVERLIDRRPVGSISEKEFTQSAKDYISAVDRCFHINGIIRGFENFGINSSDNSSIDFGGGAAIINGNVVTANPSKIRIPEIVENGNGPGSSLNWGICVNENGNFITIPITNIKQHFFVQAGTGGGTPYYVPSVTFDEIQNERKDLLLIYIVNVTINSVTINSISDARKYLLNHSSNIELSISDDEFLGSFTDFNQIKTWLNHTSSEKITVKIKGNITVDSPIDLTEISKSLTLIGDGGRIIVNSASGLILKSNTKIIDIDFVYNHVLSSFDTNDLCHISNNNFCIKLFDGSSNCEISGCTFSHGTLGERNPYIGFYTDSTSNIENIKINNNVFESSQNSFNCAIGFLKINNSGFATITNLEVFNNIIEGKQSILFASETGNGFISETVRINNNIAENGFIGAFFNSATSSGFDNVKNYFEIIGNNCRAIFTPNENGKEKEASLSSLANVSTLNILRNRCDYMSFHAGQRSIVKYNYINGLIDSDLLNVVDYNNSGNVDGLLVVRGAGEINISENEILNISSISNNGIYKQDTHFMGGHICKNKISRLTTSTITSFIDISNDAGNATPTVITENILSSTAVNSGGVSNNNTIIYNEKDIVERNVNHRKSALVNFSQVYPIVRRNSATSVNSVWPPITDTCISSIVYANNAGGFQVDIPCITGAEPLGPVFRGFVSWDFDCTSIVPFGAKVVGLEMNYSVTSPKWDSGSIFLSIYNSNVSDIIGRDNANLTSGSGTLSISSSSGTTPLATPKRVGDNEYLRIQVSLIDLDPNTINTVSISNLRVNYTF